VQIDLDSLPNDPAVLQRMLREIVPELKAENEKLLLLIDALLRHRYGPRSEKLSLDQLRLALEDQEQADAERDAAKDAKDAAEPAEKRRRPPANRNRGVLPSHLPRYEVVIDIDHKECPCCGGALHMIDEERSEPLLGPHRVRAF
jgi:transposase